MKRCCYCNDPCGDYGVCNACLDEFVEYCDNNVSFSEEFPSIYERRMSNLLLEEKKEV